MSANNFRQQQKNLISPTSLSIPNKALLKCSQNTVLTTKKKHRAHAGLVDQFDLPMYMALCKFEFDLPMYMALCKFENSKTQLIFTVVKLLLSNNVGKSKSLYLVLDVGSLKNDVGLKRQFKLKH